MEFDASQCHDIFYEFGESASEQWIGMLEGRGNLRVFPSPNLGGSFLLHDAWVPTVVGGPAPRVEWLKPLVWVL